jgi:hypothetical protein
MGKMKPSMTIATYELSMHIATMAMPVATVVMPVTTDFFFKKESLEQIDPFNILHNMIEQIDPFD